MSDISKGSREQINIQLDNSKFWDVVLDDSNLNCLNCNEVISGDTVLSMEVTNPSGECNSLLWDCAVSFTGDVCDIGLTGFDNRFVNNFTGETFNPSGDTRFCLFPVSGDNFCYDLTATGGTNEPNSVQFCGGFMQGFYKLEDYEYQTLPNLYYKGWTKEFWINKRSCPQNEPTIITGETVYIETIDGESFEITELWENTYDNGPCEGKPILNDIYPNNEGIFYYWGLRAENKFCLFSPLSGATTCEGTPLGYDYSVEEKELEINPFLYYNRKQACDSNKEYEVVQEDCCKSLINNAMAFRIGKDNDVSVRLLTTTGECVSVDGTVKFSGSPMVEEYNSMEGVISNDTWHLVTVKFEPFDTSECLTYRTGIGILSIYVDGMLKLKIDAFPEFIPYALDEDKNKQLAVPYNISLGGGTQGLLEAYPNDLGENIPMLGYTVCDYSTILTAPCTFNGISIDGIEYESPTLSADEPELIQLWLEMNITGMTSEITVESRLMGFDKRSSIDIKIKGSNQSLDYIMLQNNSKSFFCDPICYNIPPHLGFCGYLEEIFAGTFIGSIAEFRIHERPLCLQEIRCNYDAQKRKYNKPFRITCEN